MLVREHELGDEEARHAGLKVTLCSIKQGSWPIDRPELVGQGPPARISRGRWSRTRPRSTRPRARRNTSRYQAKSQRDRRGRSHACRSHVSRCPGAADRRQPRSHSPGFESHGCRRATAGWRPPATHPGKHRTGRGPPDRPDQRWRRWHYSVRDGVSRSIRIGVLTAPVGVHHIVVRHRFLSAEPAKLGTWTGLTQPYPRAGSSSQSSENSSSHSGMIARLKR